MNEKPSTTNAGIVEKNVRADTAFAGQNEYDDEFNLIELTAELLHYWWLLVAGLLVGCILAAVYTFGLVTPQYTATSTIYIFSKSTSITSLADVQVGTQLTVDFQMLATTREVIEPVVEKLGLDYSFEHMKKNIVVTNPSGSHMLQISVIDPDPVRAALISNTLADALRDQIADIMNTDRPTIAEKAVAPTNPSSPNTKMNIALGGLLVMLLAAAIVVVRFLLDDTVKNNEDVEKYLGLKVLAEIPYDKAIRS